MNINRRWLAAGGVAAALAVGFTGTSLAQSDEDPPAAAVAERDDVREDEAEGEDVAITGTALDRAAAAALDHLGEGRVTDTEVGDEESYYEVEVTLDDGRQVDVQLDEQFHVVGDEADDAQVDD